MLSAKCQQFFRFTKCTRTIISQSALGSLENIVGPLNVVTSESVREHHGKDESHFETCPPDVVIFPTSTQHVSECLKFCHKSHIPVVPFGTGTGLEGGVLARQGGVCLDLCKMDQVVEVNALDFDATVEPGVTRKSLNSYIRDTGLWFTVDPGADASVCGMAATGASGTNAVRYGTMRENVINLEVVLADGRILHTAGQGGHSRKTSAGYNLTNLMVGSEGTLGVITKATVRLYGIPEAIVSAVCHFSSVKDAVNTTLDILQSGIPIARIEFLDELSMDACNKYSNLEYAVAPTLFLEFHGTERNVEEQAKDVASLAEAYGGSQFVWAKDTETRNKLWKARHDAFYAALALRPGSKSYTTDVCVPISQLPEQIAQAVQEIEQSGLIGPIVSHIGDGNYHTLLLVDPDKPGDMEVAKTLANNMAERAIAVGGTCTGEHGIGLGKRHLLVKELGEIGVGVMRQLKTALDPNNILNPDKVFETKV